MPPLFLSLFVLVLLGVLGLFLFITEPFQRHSRQFVPGPSPSPSGKQPSYVLSRDIIIPTENWKTYENKTLGFSLEIPEGWTRKVYDKDNNREYFGMISPEGKTITFMATRSYNKSLDTFVRYRFGTQAETRITDSTQGRYFFRRNIDSHTNDYGFYMYQNPILYMLESNGYSGEERALKTPEEEQLFKEVALSLKLTPVASPFPENPPVAKRPSFDLKTSEKSTSASRTFTSKRFNLSLKASSAWSGKEAPQLDGPDTLHLSSSAYSGTTPRSQGKNAQIWIGGPFIFSTSGGICFNQICETIGQVELNIQGTTYTTDLIRASSNNFGDPSQNVFDYYAFQFSLDENKGYQEGISVPEITAYFFTKEEGLEIVKMLQSLTSVQ